MAKHNHVDHLPFQDLLSIHQYFNRLDGTKSETAKEIINKIENIISNRIQPNATGTQHGKSEIR